MTSNAATRPAPSSSNADLVIIPADANVPHDMGALHALAVLSFCPSKGAQRRAASRHIAGLIASALAV